VTDAALGLRGARHTWPGGVEALRDVDLEVAGGSFVSLLGPSGCGKSTLLRIAAGLLRPTAGTVQATASARGDVGFVFQEPTLLPWATVRANVALPLRLLGRADRDGDVEAAVRHVGLAGFEAARPHELSGGMRMRVSIARALVTRPRLLLMDEPFAALDEITRQRLNDDLLALQAEDRLTVLFVTHSVFESVYLSDRVVVMSPRPGRVVADVAVPLARPRSLETRLGADYAALCREVSARLTEAMAA
jgi:NitT/TauT family transport system ATP-binding protein